MYDMSHCLCVQGKISQIGTSCCEMCEYHLQVVRVRTLCLCPYCVCVGTECVCVCVCESVLSVCVSVGTECVCVSVGTETECRKTVGTLNYIKVDDCQSQQQIELHYCEVRTHTVI